MIYLDRKLPAARATTATAAATASATATTTTATETTATTATGIHFLSFAASSAIRTTGWRSEALFLKEGLLSFGESILGVAIAAGEGLIGHMTALL